MKRGFTLIELLVVIVLLGFLATLITGNFVTSLKKGRDAKRKADLEQITRALEMYYEDNKAYPGTVSFGGQLCAPGADGCSTKIYMQKVPKDPLGTNYGYENSTGNYYRLNACLENKLQILPYISTQVAGFSCNNPCRNPTDTADVTSCIWGVTSSNATP